MEKQTLNGIEVTIVRNDSNLEHGKEFFAMGRILTFFEKRDLTNSSVYIAKIVDVDGFSHCGYFFLEKYTRGPEGNGFSELYIKQIDVYELKTYLRKWVKSSLAYEPK